MIDLKMPGGIYDPPKKRDMGSLKKAVETMNTAFDGAEKALTEVPQSTQKEPEVKKVAKEEVTVVEDPNSVLMENLGTDLENLQADIAAVIQLVKNSGNKKELEELKAENEELKKRLVEVEEKAKKFDALKAMMS